MTATHELPVQASDRGNWAPYGRTVGLLTAVGVLLAGQMYAVIVLFGPMAIDLHASVERLTWTATAYGLAYAIGLMFSGPATDRFGPRALLAAGGIAAGISTALVGLGTDLVSECLLRAVQGLACATFSPAAFTYLAEKLAPERRSQGLAWMVNGSFSSAILTQVAAQAWTTQFSWRGFFMVAGLLVVLGAVAMRLRLPATPVHHAPSMGAAFLGMTRLLGNPRLLALYGTGLTLLGGFVAVYTAVSLAGPESVIHDPQALLTLRASALPAMLVAPLAARWLVRIPVRYRGAGFVALSAVAILGASFAGEQVVLLGVFLFVFVAGLGVAAPALLEIVGGMAPESRGAAIALYASVLYVGASLGPIATAALLDVGFGGILRAVAVILVVGVGLAVLATRRR
ncbi:MFS transporter [Pseudonocardiaceae bacterium YIM PH 21723]|nr:MFS transporter [Pseudonocardiaceae bacterium YIM PH 21723]